MSGEEAQDAIAEKAKEDLETALRTFYETVEPGVYLSDWVLIGHKLSTELERNNQSSVSVLVRTGQPFPMTRGLLDVVLTAERRSDWAA